jgi:hypothetical protein
MDDFDPQPEGLAEGIVAAAFYPAAIGRARAI